MVYVHMLFVNKFCSYWKYYNITRDIPDLTFKSVYIFSMNPANVLKSTIRTLCDTCSHLTLKTPGRRHWRRFTLFIWAVFTLYSWASIANFEQIIVCWKRSNHKNNHSKQDLFFYLILQLLKSVLRYVWQRMEEEWVSLNYPLVIYNKVKQKYLTFFKSLLFWIKFFTPFSVCERHTQSYLN